MTGQMTIGDIATEPLEFAHCAAWCAEHPEATRWMVWRAKQINKEENRKASFRLDIEPELARRAREFGLDAGTYRGVDHNLTADLARYLEASRGVRFRLRGSKRELTKNATPGVGGAAA